MEDQTGHSASGLTRFQKAYARSGPTELPLQFKCFSPVKQANAAKAEKRREELLAAIRAGGAELAQAAE